MDEISGGWHLGYHDGDSAHVDRQRRRSTATILVHLLSMMHTARVLVLVVAARHLDHPEVSRCVGTHDESRWCP